MTIRGKLVRIVPLDWNELRRKELRPDGVTIRTVFDQLDEAGDSWADFWRRGVSLNRARQKLERLNATRRVPQEAEVH